MLLSQTAVWAWANLLSSEPWWSKLLGKDHNHSFLIWDCRDEYSLSDAQNVQNYENIPYYL